METAAFNNPIHRIILSRLAAAWVALSLLFGGVAYIIELEKIDDFVVALATAESERFKLFGIPLEPAEDSASVRLLQSRAREFASENFVVIEIYNRQRQLLVEAVNPRHQKIEQELKHERTWGWMRSGHHHRLMILQSQIDMVQGRMAILGEGARKRRQK